MPTLILLDKSLSMGRAVGWPHGLAARPGGSMPTRFSLARATAATIVDHLQANLPFEYTSLMTFSSRCKTEVEFGNNNHQELREALRQIHLGDRTAWSAALKANYLPDRTDHGGGDGRNAAAVAGRDAVQASHCVARFAKGASKVDSADADALSKDGGGGVVPLDIAMGLQGIMTGMGEFLSSQFAAFKGTLRFGHLESAIRLYPPPSGATGIERALRENIEIHGFLPRVQVESPAVLSRHVIMPPHVPGDMLQKDAPDFRALLYQVLKGE
eukprot:gene12556-17896_t